MNFRERFTSSFSFSILAALLIAGLSLTASAQTTLSTGSIQGTVTDPSGAVLSGVKVTITSKSTAQAYTETTNGSGLYTSGALTPGDYVVKAQASGFKSAQLPVTIQVGVTATGNFKLTVGQSSETVEVEGSTVAVNTEQATVEGVLTSQQIENLPINGRNFLDLAQLEPGVQIQEGSTFDPTKNGFSSISFGGRFGRTARIEVDGVDISDETVGTTTQNIPASAIQEFQISQSSLDLSTELTSSGAVSVTTYSGTNTIHGEAFGLFRGNQIAAALPGNSPPPFQRQQWGGRLGGYIIKDKLFWFVDAERTKQDLTAAEPFSTPFSALDTTLGQPFRDLMTDGKLDWQIHGSAHAFYRFNYEQNSQIRPFGSSSSLQGFDNNDHTPSHTLGLDFNTGNFTHSIRFSYLRFHNAIGDGTNSIAAGIDNPIPGLGININAPIAGNCVISGGGSYCGGPNLLAPQQTYQSNHQIKYDGSRVYGKHVIRYGVAFNHIQGGGLAAFFTFPQVGTSNLPVSATPTDPTSYPADWVFLGNGVGFSTPNKAFGFPAGGLGPDNRFEAYAGDNWRIRHNISFLYGLHYVHDTGRVDSNLGPLPTLNDWGPGLGNRVRTPGTDFAPELGVAWDLGGKGKTVLRAGGGLYYENSIWNNVLFDSPARIQQGIFSATPLVCAAGGNTGPFPWPTNLGTSTMPIAGGAGTYNGDGTVTANFCGQTISAAAPGILALSDAFKSAAASLTGLEPNANYVGNTLNVANANGFDVFNPNYRTPRSWQMNVGIQHQIRPGMVFSADYLRNIGELYLLALDMNHSGAAYSFNLANAIAARNAAQTANGCAAGPGQASCMVGALGVAGAQAAYSGAGLDSNIQTTGGAPCNFCAFPGTNPVSGNTGTVGVLDMLTPSGRSVLNALQLKLVQQVTSPMHGIKAMNLEVSYSLSKFVSQVQDQDFINLAVNNDNPLQFTGPNALDRRHQLSFGTTFDVPFYTRISFIGHFYSPLAQNLYLPQTTNGGEIYASDWLGTGLGSNSQGEPVPGTQIGQFDRGTNAGNLQNVINNYNSKYAGSLTPAGNRLVNSGVMSSSDMTLLGWVMQPLPAVAPGALDFPWLKAFDFKASWPIKLKERIAIEPSVSIFNLFNFSNAFLPGNLPTATLGTPTSVGEVTQAGILPYRASFQSGTYALGAPRQFEFGLKVDF